MISLLQETTETRIVGGLIITFCTISLLLNPFLLFCYARRPPSLQTTMFRCLAIADFVTTFLPALYFGYREIKGNHDSVYRLFLVYHCIPGCVSKVLAVLLAVTRSVTIVFPFYNVRRGVILAYFVVFVVVMTTINMTSVVVATLDIIVSQQNETVGFSKYQAVLDDMEDFLRTHTFTNRADLNELLCWGISLVHVCLGLGCSIFTVLYLYATTGGLGDCKKRRQGAITILLMNIPYVIAVINGMDAFIGSGLTFGPFDMRYFQYAHIPIFTSAYNPLIIIARKDSYRQLLLHFIKFTILRLPGDRKLKQYHTRSENIPHQQTRRFYMKDAMV